MASSDEMLVARCQEGDKRAFELLVQKYQRRIYHLIHRITQDPDVVEPLTQDVFLKAYRSISSFRGASQFYTWLYRIAVNTCLSHVKREPSHRCHEDPQDINPRHFSPEADALLPENPEQQVMRKELLRQVMSAVRDLPEEFRTTVVLREFTGLNYEEIAEVLEIPLGTVRSRIFRSRALLREALGSLR